MHSEWLKLQKLIIGFLFNSGKVSDLQKARTYVESRHFIGKYGEFWRLIKAYYDKHQSMLSLSILRDLARAKKWSEQELMEYEQLLDECQEVAQDVREGDFTYYLDRMIDSYRQTMFSEAMSDGMQSLQNQGFLPARDLVLSRLSAIDKGGGLYSSEIDLRGGVDAFIKSVSEAKVQHAVAVRFGLPKLDDIILGLRRGDFCLIAAFAGVGKTSLCVNTAVDVAFTQTKNVVFVTTETVIDGLLRRIFSRVSRLPLFDTAIPSSAMKAGKLTPEQNEVLLKIKAHLKSGSPGHFKVVQAPPDASLSWLRGRLLQFESSFRVDLVILDDLRNLRTETKRRSEWEEFNDLLKGAKALARTHAGHGVPLISPYQISREGQKAKLVSNTSRYTLMALSSSSEAERSPDIIITEIPNEDEQESMVLHVLKQRDGKTNKEVRVRAEFDFQLFEEISEGEFGFES